jgi:hypothetical protein
MIAAVAAFKNINFEKPRRCVSCYIFSEKSRYCRCKLDKKIIFWGLWYQLGSNQLQKDFQSV